MIIHSFSSLILFLLKIGDKRFDVELRSSNKLFSKKPISQVSYTNNIQHYDAVMANSLSGFIDKGIHWFIEFLQLNSFL